MIQKYLKKEKVIRKKRYRKVLIICVYYFQISQWGARKRRNNEFEKQGGESRSVFHTRETKSPQVTKKSAVNRLSQPEHGS